MHSNQVNLIAKIDILNNQAENGHGKSHYNSSKLVANIQNIETDYDNYANFKGN
jgi:hypothetical protein